MIEAHRLRARGWSPEDIRRSQRHATSHHRGLFALVLLLIATTGFAMILWLLPLLILGPPLMVVPIVFVLGVFLGFLFVQTLTHNGLATHHGGALALAVLAAILGSIILVRIGLWWYVLPLCAGILTPYYARWRTHGAAR